MKVGSALFALLDTELKGFITWIEKNNSAIMLFTSGERAEAYLEAVNRNRPIIVYSIKKTAARDFVDQMLKSDIRYALIDVPPEQTDILNSYPDEVVRNYALVDLKTLRARMA